MSFKPKLILMKTFLQSQFEVVEVYEFQTKVNSYADVCWLAVWSYLSLCVSTKTEFLWRHFLSLSLKLCNFRSFKQNRILMNKFLESQFGVKQVDEFQTKANSYDDLCWVSVSSYLSLRISNKREFLWRHFLNLS